MPTSTPDVSDEIADNPVVEPAKAPKKTTRRKKPAEAKSESNQTAEVKGSVATTELKATCTQELLSKYVQVAVKAVAAQPTSDLQYLKITAHMGLQTIELSSFNQSQGLTLSVPATVEQEGVLLCRPKEFSDLVQRLPNTAVSLIGSNTSITLLTSISRSEVQAKSDKGYPQVPRGAETESFMLQGSTLQQGILKTVGCTEQDETKGIINGVNFQLWTKGELAVLACCATNSKVLAMYQSEELPQKAPDAEFTIAAKVVRGLIELAGIGQTVEVRVSKQGEGESQFVEFHCAEKQEGQAPQIHQFVGSLLAGQFPNCRGVVPTEHQVQVTVDKDLLLANLDRALIIAHAKEFKSVSLSIDPEDGEVDVFTEAQGVGNHHEVTSAQVSGEKIKAMFSCQDLVELIRQFNSTEVRLCLRAGCPVLIDSPSRGEFKGMAAPNVEKG